MAVEVSRHPDKSMPPNQSCHNCGTPVPGEIWYLTYGDTMDLYGNVIVIRTRTGKRFKATVFCNGCLSEACVTYGEPPYIPVLQAMPYKEAKERAAKLNRRPRSRPRRFTAGGKAEERIAAKAAVKLRREPSRPWWITD